MGNGFWAGDAIALSMEIETNRVLHQKREANLRKIKNQAEEDNAANLAEKHALRAALAKLDPKHPLLVNKSLQEKVQDAGVRAMTLTNTYEAAREAGTTFKY